ncbi:MAG: phosphoribosyl-AMP cyclohydrolase [Anaerolineales bacterium]|nr:phosphoribosyl-AMP cyclohydrolase [Anaerolineales bacterium]
MKNLKFDANGLLTGIAQDNHSKQVLMVAMMNAEAVKRTLETGLAHFWSRSREELWLKGATSGNFLEVHKVFVDCDGDVLLMYVTPQGPACHTGEQSCFFTELEMTNAK